MNGKVLKLYITKNGTKRVREEVETITVDNNGVVDDKFYAKNLQRSVLITAVQSYELAKTKEIDLPFGSLGENILIDINPYSLLPGQQLIIGETVLEITQNCTLCKGLSSVNPALPKVLKNDRGIFAKVVSGKSQISLGDQVKF
ncbi:MAG: MOSC domain-containing protein [Epsilonproteobacteria bacterium]|nr:MOSC domain-containing protein [Campylobacterota bacterium]